MKIKITAILIICIILLAGCSIPDISESTTNNSEDSNVINNVTTDSSETIFTIYKIDSDTFDSSLEKNSFENILKVSSKYFNYPQDGNNYVTYSNTVFEITDNYVDLFSNLTFWEDYFAEDNSNEKIEHFVIFEAPYTPVSAWIKTNIDTYFLTLDAVTTFSLYSQSDYVEQYKSHQFSLKINGAAASKSNSVKTYYQNAKLPLLEILYSCGADIKWKNDNQVNITLNNEKYLLDVKNNHFYNKNDKKNDILSVCTGGGPYHMYYSNGEYYVDSDTLQSVMHEMNQDIEIEYDTDNKIVSIITTTYI